MSIIPPGIAQNLKFYLSGPLPCPYLPAQVERKLFTRLDDVNLETNAAINGALCRAGFRRSHDVVYRPACSDCNACIPVRVPVDHFQPSRGQKRISARNRDLTWESAEPVPTQELFDLFALYQNTRHGDSDMARMSADDFAAMLQEGRAHTRLFTLRNNAQELQGCMIADDVGDGFSAVYSFFSPAEPRRSLGTALILSLIEHTRARYRPHLYLGYWVEASRKMAYKSQFKPYQCLGAHGWVWQERSVP